MSPQTTRRHQTPTVRPATGQPDGRMGGPVPHSQHPAGWYRTMDRGFAVDHYGFPALPRRGERHTAPDGSVWEFDLTGTDWWELAEYAPSETDRSIGTFHDDARMGRSPNIPELSVGEVYRHTSTDAADIEIAGPLRNFGYAQVGLVPIPLPVVGRVWIGRMEIPLAGTVEILCTAEGLASRGYALTDITERPTDE